MTARTHRAKILRLDSAARARLADRSQPPLPSKEMFRVRRDMALLLGYYEMLDVVPSEQQQMVMRVIAEKGQELSNILRPLLELHRTDQRPSLEQYRQTRLRTRALLADYRRILRALEGQLPGLSKTKQS